MTFDDFWTMERRFWLSGPDFYDHALAADAHMIFPPPVGILTGEAIIEGLGQAPRWASVEFSDRIASRAGQTVVLAYRAVGSRNGEEPYVALCSSTYATTDDGWRLLSHQQTPVPPSP